MKRTSNLFLGCLVILGAFPSVSLASSVECDTRTPQLAFAVKEWKAYVAILSSQYKPQLLARTNFLDWNRTLAEVEMGAFGL